MLTTDLKSEIKLKTRIGMVKEAFNNNKKKNLLCSSTDLDTRKKLCVGGRCVLLYGRGKRSFWGRERIIQSWLLRCGYGDN